MSGAAPIVIYAEDDLVTQHTVEAELGDAGFEVVLATDGDSALAVLADRIDGVAALVTDINLGGGIDGWEVAHQARMLSPSIPVIYVSGRESSEWTARGVPCSLMIAKPFAPAQIVVAIASLLNETGPRR